MDPQLRILPMTQELTLKNPKYKSVWDIRKKYCYLAICGTYLENSRFLKTQNMWVPYPLPNKI